MSQERKDTAGRSAFIIAVSVRMSSLQRRNSEVSFVGAEAQFALAGMAMDATTYSHALVGLVEESIAIVVYILGVSGAAKQNHFLVDLTLGGRFISCRS